MTESEAIKEIRFNMSTIGLSNEAAKRVVEARDMAIQAIEKQIPKKPKTDDRYVMYICPCCNDFIKVSHNYCPNCGQELDWSDEE